MGYRWLVTGVLVVHFGYLAYLVFGGFLAWRWPRTIGLHVLAALWGLAVIAVPLDCPLTAVENWARTRAGEAIPQRAFVDRYIEGVLYPERFTNLLRVLAAAAVIGSWVGYAVLRRRRAHRDTEAKSRDSSRGTATV